jgi:uncharacterized membrane protein YjjP (DUF1212 family)
MPAAPENATQTPEDHIAASQAFVMDLARAFLIYGTAAHRLEEILTVVTRRLGMDGEFFSVPTAVIASFDHTAAPRTHLVRAEPGDANLEKLVLLDELTESVLAGTLTPAAGTKKVREIVSAPPRFGPVVVTLCYALASASMRVSFGGSAEEAGVAGAIGLIVGALWACVLPRQGLRRLFEIFAAGLASFLAYAAVPIGGPSTVYLTTVAGLIVLVPGLTLTVALTELATVNLVSGTARLMGAGITFLKLALGVAVGGRLGSAFFGAASSMDVMIVPLWVRLASVFFAALAFSVLFQSHPRDVAWIVVVSLLATAGAYAGVAWVGPYLGPSFGAFLGTTSSNLYARCLRRPARVPLTAGLILLVPGSVGFRSVSLLLENETLSGINTAFGMVLAATALVAGVLFASLLVPPRRLL